MHAISQRVKYVSIGVFGVLYITFTAILGDRLNEWNDQISGQCFNASKIALPNARHPEVDQVYLGITSWYVFSLLLCATVYCRVEQIRSEWQGRILLISSLELILHLYMVIALRLSNQSLLNDASLEEQWGSAQVLALAMFGATLVECAKRLEDMRVDYFCPKPAWRSEISQCMQNIVLGVKDDCDSKATTAEAPNELQLDRRKIFP